MPKILFFAPANGLAIDSMEDLIPAGWELFHVDPLVANSSEQIALATVADFLVVSNRIVNSEVLQAGKKIRLVQLMSAGFDSFPLSDAGEIGIPVANASGTNAQGVAEFALTLMLACYRHLPALDRSTREGEWHSNSAVYQESYEIQDKTIGIVGLGHIGAILARIVQGFNPRLLYYDLIPRPELQNELAVERVSLDQLLSQSDIVTLHTPLNHATKALIGERELSLMKKTSILINTCRGPVVDEQALYEALRTKNIWGAGLDVFEEEPTPFNNPLLGLENVVVSPHVAGKTLESYPRRVHFTYENIRKVLAGDQPLNVILAN